MKTERLPSSVKVAAAALGVSTWTIREEIRAGRIDSVRLGSRILIPLRELQRLVNPPETATDAAANMNDIDRQPEATAGA